ncbi:MAG: UDP-3-O-(3-hydroxymyristoyl)glucosamine N-acyltransferase, partial [Muribaculaceae bacterium]|nr:UDP-3-O-(3-hydroxymyristoyl)glucosamine N-acyltransferase [Muribaculaceae bacterium]
IRENSYIGAFAYIGKVARLGKNGKIYPQAYVGEGVVIGDDTVIRAGVKIYEGCRIGARCIIHSGAVIGADGFGFAPNNGHFEKIPQTGIVVIADDVEIGANTTVDRATFGQTSIGRGTKLDNLIQVAHNVTIGEDNVFASQTGIAGSVHIGNGNMIAGQCGFAGHITIGDYNEIGAQSGIPKSVGSHQRLMGYPAVDARQFAKTQVYIKNLGKLFTEFNTIKK